jgi:hypothetical protein
MTEPEFQQINISIEDDSIPHEDFGSEDDILQGDTHPNPQNQKQIIHEWMFRAGFVCSLSFLGYALSP